MKTLLHAIRVGSALLGTATMCYAGSLKFDGVDDYVATPNLRNSFANETVTIESWFKAQKPGVILDERDNMEGGWRNSQIEIVATANTLQGEVRIRVWPLSQAQCLRLGNVAYDTWNHVVLRYNKATLTLDGFLNGMKSASSVSGLDRQAPWEGSPTTIIYALGLNDNANLGSGAYFQGLMDEFRVWNVAQTDAEIANNWKRRLAGNEANLVAYYPMEEGAGTMTADASGHGYTGTLVNQPLWNTAEDAVAPVALTQSTTVLTNTSAQLNALVNTNGARTTNRFEWGAASTALAFDGVDDYVSIPLTLPDTGTIEMWSYVTPFHDYQTLFDNSVHANDWEMWIYGSGWARFRLDRNDTSWCAFLLNVPNQWYHFAVMWQRNGTRVDYTLCVNGIQRFVVTNAAWATPGNNFFLAGGNPGNAKGNGQIDEVRIWNVARSPAEIRTNMYARVATNAPGLVAYYRLDEGTGTLTADATGSGATGTFVGSPAWMPGARPVLDQVTAPQAVAGTNLVLNLDGVDDYVRVPAGIWFSNEFTIETWVYEGNYNSWSRVIDFGNGGPSDNVVLAVTQGTTGKPNFDVYRGNVSQNLTTPDPLPLNQWVHLAATLKNNIGTIYVNGVAVVSGTVTAPSGTVTRNNNYIGLDNWGGSTHANALFDDLRLWNVARTPAQIREFMTNEVAPNDPNLILNYRFDEPSGSTALDSRSSSVQNGTLTNGASRLSSLPASTTLSPLAAGTVYHVRSVAQNTNGTTAGNLERFATLTPGSGTALEFDGADDYVSVPLVLPDTGTIEMWYYVKPYDAPQTLFDNSANADDWEMWISPTGEVGYRVQDLACRYNLGPLEGPNQWCHFAGTWLKHGTQVDSKLFINGVERAVVANQAWINPGSTFYLAGGNPGNVKGDGQMDEVRIWNRARTAEEISRDRNVRLAGTETGLVAYYRMDEGAGLTLFDATTNANHGLLVNGPLHVPSAAPVSLPIAVTLPATSIQYGNATLNGTVKGDGTIPTTNYFEYGVGLPLEVKFYDLGFVPQHMNEINFEGRTPARVESFATINYPNSAAKPMWLGGPNDQYAARFTGHLVIPTEGDYTFYTSSDDGSLLYINGALVVANDFYQSMTERSGRIHLSPGSHPFVLEYFQGPGGWGLVLSYDGPGISKQVIPPAAFAAGMFTDPTPAQDLGINSNALPVNVAIQDLTGATTYHYRAVAVNANGTNYGADQTFTMPHPAALTALSFDGLDDYIQVGDRPELKMTTNLTLEAWIKPSGPGSGDGNIMGREGDYLLSRGGGRHPPLRPRGAIVLFLELDEYPRGCSIGPMDPCGAQLRQHEYPFVHQWHVCLHESPARADHRLRFRQE